MSRLRSGSNFRKRTQARLENPKPPPRMRAIPKRQPQSQFRKAVSSEDSSSELHGLAGVAFTDGDLEGNGVGGGRGEEVGDGGHLHPAVGLHGLAAVDDFDGGELREVARNVDAEGFAAAEEVLRLGGLEGEASERDGRASGDGEGRGLLGNAGGGDDVNGAVDGRDRVLDAALGSNLDGKAAPFAAGCDAGRGRAAYVPRGLAGGSGRDYRLQSQ